MSWFSDTNKVRVDLLDSIDSVKGHIYQFTIKNNSQEKIYLLGDSNTIFDFSVPYADNSGLLIGFGATSSPIYLSYTDYYSIHVLNPNEEVKTRFFEFKYNAPNYSLEIGFDILYENTGYDNLNRILITEYWRNCERISMKIKP